VPRRAADHAAGAEIKNIDELMLLNMAAGWSTACTTISPRAQPGVKEATSRPATLRLYQMGSTVSKPSTRSRASAATRIRHTSPTA